MYVCPGDRSWCEKERIMRSHAGYVIQLFLTHAKANDDLSILANPLPAW